MVVGCLVCLAISSFGCLIVGHWPLVVGGLVVTFPLSLVVFGNCIETNLCDLCKCLGSRMFLLLRLRLRLEALQPLLVLDLEVHGEFGARCALLLAQRVAGQAAGRQF